MNGRRRVEVRFIPEAVDDLRRINERHPAVAREVLRVLSRLGAGTLSPTRLTSFGKTGDLRDCGKLLVLVDGSPEHRIVVRDLGAKGFEVVDVVVVEARADDLAYLLAGLRLDRLVDPLRRSDAQRRVTRIRRLLDSSDPASD